MQYQELVSLEATISRLEKKIIYYENAIRKHRDQKGDDRCYEDDYELYKSLPEGYIPPISAVGIDLNLCAKYQQCRQDPRIEYVSPQKQIEEQNIRIRYQKEKIETLLDECGKWKRKAGY
jgi:hypothetical protein